MLQAHVAPRKGLKKRFVDKGGGDCLGECFKVEEGKDLALIYSLSDFCTLILRQKSNEGVMGDGMGRGDKQGEGL